jgi:large subunit ribosomal protein L18
MKKRRIKLRFRRRREGKTDYGARAVLLKSSLPRLVVRKTNRYIIVQIVKTKEAQDFVVSSANSSELKQFGWKESFKNTSAAYLAGFLLATKAGIKEAVSDIGLYRSTKGSKIYAAIKGASDAGLKINYGESMMPSEERIKGKKADMFESVKEQIKTIKEKGKNEKGKRN